MARLPSTLRPPNPTYALARRLQDDVNICIWFHCEEDAIGTYGVSMCMKHAVKSYLQFARLLQDNLAPLESSASALLVAQGPDMSKLRRMDYRAKLRDRAEAFIGPGPHVYFIHFGNRIKIGTSKNVAYRLRALPRDELLAVVAGGVDEERRYHAMFARHRINGDWFRAAPDLISYAQSLNEGDDAVVSWFNSRKQSLDKRRRSGMFPKQRRRDGDGA